MWRSHAQQMQPIFQYLLSNGKQRQVLTDKVSYIVSSKSYFAAALRGSLSSGDIQLICYESEDELLFLKNLCLFRWELLDSRNAVAIDETIKIIYEHHRKVPFGEIDELESEWLFMLSHKDNTFNVLSKYMENDCKDRRISSFDRL